MISTRLFSLLLLLTGLTCGLSGCLTPPEYGIVPAIEFKDLTVVRYAPARQAPIDTFKITINFKDGDGDLGLTPDEIAAPPYSRTNADGSVNTNQQFNYYLRVFRRVPPSLVFEEIFPGDEFGHYPLLNGGVDSKPAPLKGDLTFRRFYSLGSPFNPGDEVKFTVSIKDRALHESNTVESDIHVIKPR